LKWSIIREMEQHYGKWSIIREMQEVLKIEQTQGNGAGQGNGA